MSSRARRSSSVARPMSIAPDLRGVPDRRRHRRHRAALGKPADQLVGVLLGPPAIGRRKRNDDRERSRCARPDAGAFGAGDGGGGVSGR